MPDAYRGAVLFDLDGTLIDTAADFIAIINRMRAEEGMPALPDDLIRSYVSEGARAMVTLGFGLKEGESGFDDKLNTFLDSYSDTLGDEAGLFDGYEKLLEHLDSKQLGWGIVTNKPARFTDPLLAKLGLTPSEGIAICPCHLEEKKPDPEGLNLALERLGLTADQCIYVGDHIRDVEAAHNAGMKSVACAFGYIKEDDDIHSWQADHIVATVDELHLLIQELFD